MDPVKFGYWFPADVSTHGPSVDLLIDYVHYLAVALFVGWGIFMLYCLIRFRQRPGHKAQYELPHFKGSKYAEVAVALIELVLLLGFSIPVWASIRYELPRTDAPDKVVVRCIAEQFAWYFWYPGPDGEFEPASADRIKPSNPLGLRDPSRDAVSKDEFHFPVNRPIVVYVTSRDVIHGFNIPLMRVKHDAVPGLNIPIWFQATKTNDEIFAAMSPERLRIGPALVGRKEPYIAMEAVKAADGSDLLKSGDTFVFGEALVKGLTGAGVQELSVKLKFPVELACAQLCGNGHSGMRAAVSIDTEEQFAAFIAGKMAK
ncbi:MAG: hypothetical protein HYY93_01640 [Planctomycetes bacterium]|nr:hypothetical protein [Planctomycetota bacterium]